MDFETRNFGFGVTEAREEDGEGIVEGYAVVFDSPADIGGMFREIIDRDALVGTDMTDVRMCLNHDTSYVYARSRRNNGNSTLQLMPDEKGLKIRASLAVDSSPKAQDYYTAVKRGDMDKMSFIFSVEDEEWRNLESDYPTRIIKKIGKIVEVGAVTFPAYQETSISARSSEALGKAKVALDSAKRSVVKETLDSEIEILKTKIQIL